ncbi:hypothetical protein N7532_003344 [Penicillium argentinense]|uniref:Uncharacterized protein n=1 Tax=Penicillium argentinense TaxID=1131581 RepID=A0A9W9FMV2_9EURO|nr:uncharacterized protein N7532_003344 [Penicillium argentinense]KAJ5102815.1 hypothetical protein N7532_003344 [Penicillium argentinense]
MENESFDRPVRFFVTGKYLAIRYQNNAFELYEDYHARGSLFYISDDNEKIIYNREYVATLTSHLSYNGDVFFIHNGSGYLGLDGTWKKSVVEAVNIQIDPYGSIDEDTEPFVPLSIPNPIIDASHPISADGIDLYHPDKWFCLYPITGDCLWLGDAAEFEGKLIFGGEPYSLGIGMRLSELKGKICIRTNTGKFLSVIMEDSLTEYLDGGCKQHTRSSRCPRCMKWYTVGYSSEPDGSLSLIPHGLPSMFVLYDGVCYYRVDVIKASYADVNRVESIEEATLFQFVA